MNHSHITTEELIDYLHGELPAERDAFVFAHLEGCSSCRAVRDSEGSLTELLRASAEVEQEFPAMIRARVWEAVRHERPSWYSALRSALRPAVAVPAAALVAAGVYFALPVAHSTTTPAGVAASYYFDQYAAASAQTPLLERTPDFTGTAPANTISQIRPESGAVAAATLDDESDH